MRTWNYDRHPYRPVGKFMTDSEGKRFELQPDAYMDAMSRIWYAATEELVGMLPSDPLREPKIPPEFWHPDLAKKLSNDQHKAKKRELDDRRVEDAYLRVER